MVYGPLRPFAVSINPLHKSRSVEVSMFSVLFIIFISALIQSCHRCRDLSLGRLLIRLLISTFRIMLPSPRHTQPGHSKRSSFRTHLLFGLLQRDSKQVFFFLSQSLVDFSDRSVYFSQYFPIKNKKYLLIPLSYRPCLTGISYY